VSGKCVFTWREADRIEYLGNFLLSALGLVTPAPRHDDSGVDFHCSLADQEKGGITFGFPFLVQARSIVKPVVHFKAPKKYRHQKNLIPAHLSWLFHQDLPMFLGLVDKEEIAIHLYSLAPIWFLHHDRENCPDCAAISLVPRIGGGGEEAGRVGPPKQTGQVTSSPESYDYKVDLGRPVASFSSKETAVREKLARHRESLRFCIDHELRNIVFARAHLPHFYWMAETRPEEGLPVPASYCGVAPAKAGELKPIQSFLGPALLPLALRYKEDNRSGLLRALRGLFREIPGDAIPHELRQALPEIFQK